MLSILSDLEDFIQSLDEYTFNKVEYQTASSGVCSETVVVINDTKIVLEKVGSEFSLSLNDKSGKLNLEEYLDLYDRFAYANREMQDVLNSEFYKSLEINLYKAVGDGLVVEYQEQENMSSGGIVLTGTAMSTPHDIVQSKVLSVGSGVPQNSLIKVGDIVLTSKEALVKLDDNTRSVKWTRVVGVVTA